VSFRQAKSNGRHPAQPAPEYLQGAVIGLDNETVDSRARGWPRFEHNQYNRALRQKRPPDGDAAVRLRDRV